MLDNYQDILTVREVADILRVTPRAVYNYIDIGAIHSFRLKDASGRPARRVFVPKQALLDYMEVPSDIG
jgi:DNA-binding transcriptional MerR regulator